MPPHFWLPWIEFGTSYELGNEGLTPQHSFWLPWSFDTLVLIDYTFYNIDQTSALGFWSV